MKSPGIRSPQTEKMSKRSHIAALAIADRYLKQCQYYSRQYCTLRQHYLRPSLESSPAALVPSKKRSLTVFTFKTWFALVGQQRKQKLWDQQQRSSRLSRSFCKLRIWSLRSVREISSSAIIHKKLLDKHFFLWISRVRRRKFCIARVTVASEFQARTRKTSSFSNWSLVVRDSRRKHNVVLLRRQRLAHRLYRTGFDSWHRVTVDSAARLNAAAVRHRFGEFVSNLSDCLAFRSLRLFFVVGPC